MQDQLAGVENLVFDVEIALETQMGAQPLPFPGMDKSGAAICVYYLNRNCPKGPSCPFRHVAGEKSVVCKHWLRGLCKKGDQCEFLHEYDLSKMPECYFFSKYNACSNKECPFRHIDPESRIKDCAWYDRGLCRNGPLCKNRHRRRVMCIAYLNGFCSDGPNCKQAHPRFDIPLADAKRGGFTSTFPQSNMSNIICHMCGEQGHKATFCPRRERPRPTEVVGLPMDQRQKPIQEITCYKCGEKGHYANKCNKGYLAFLSQSAHLTQEVRAREEQQLRMFQTQASARRAGEMQR